MGDSLSIDEEPYDIDNKAQIVCKYLFAYEKAEMNFPRQFTIDRVFDENIGNGIEPQYISQDDEVEFR